MKLNSYNNIRIKLSEFTKKYYTKVLLKGILLFLAFGLLFFIVTSGVEYFLWLNSRWRLGLLLVFIVIETLLLWKFIAEPLFYLFKLKKGIDDKQASLLIGKHFADVGDKLYNLLDLAEDENQTELLLASIEQRSETLKPIPFTKAIHFGDNLKFLKYLAIPLLLLFVIWISGNMSAFFGSYKRVVNYDVAYEPPAPFVFRVLSGELNVLENESVKVQVTTEGTVRPEQVFVEINGQELLLRQENGIYEYTFHPPLSTTRFYFKANGVSSRAYVLKALKTPAITNFEMILEYPTYTNRKAERLKSTGNASFPEGTRVTWLVNGRNTERINLITKDTSLVFSKSNDSFEVTKSIFKDVRYQISTSNTNVANYEKLEYQFDVIKDAYPAIKVNQVLDSLNPNTMYYFGEASDDYKLKHIRLVCYPEGEIDNEQILDLATPNSNFNQFYYTFPTGLQLEAGKNYIFFFEATDNDDIHNGKTTKSQEFSTVLLDDNQLKSKALESQQFIIENLDRSLQNFKKQKETLEEINENNKEKEQLNFNDQNQVKEFLNKQRRQEEMMQKFSKQLKNNLEKTHKQDEASDLLKERLERQEIEAKKNQKLLEELMKIADKINKDELGKRLEEIGKKQQSSQKNLEQLLELTKRYYVTEKAAQLAKDLDKLANEQKKEAEKENAIGKKQVQEKMNQAFDKIAKGLKELLKDNQDLKEPLDLDFDHKKEEGIKNDQKKAKEQLGVQESESKNSEKRDEAGKKAARSQKAAAQKMKEMSGQMRQSVSAGGGGSTITEDAEMLRQILDNLVVFSFKQENLYEMLEEISADSPQFSKTIRKQQELRKLFEHVDDSLFSLSLRRAELSEFVNDQIAEVYYNTDKSLEVIANGMILQGLSYQKYVLTAANSLSDFLAKILDNMQQSMQSGQGQGQGEGFQLPDIIKQQGGLKDKMEGQGKSGKGKPNAGEGEGKEGNGQKGEGDGKSDGSSQKGNGKEGKGGELGEGSGVQGDGDGGDVKGKGKGTGSKEGQGGERLGEDSGKGIGPSEEELKEIYEIYKEQQLIRQKLEKQLQDMINDSDRKLGQKLVRQMEEFENELIENGFTQRGMNKINTIQYELLKLKDAALKQGKKAERESNTNRKEFDSPITTKPAVLEDYLNEIEILNRQALPLRQNFQNKVKEYFKNND